MKVYISCHHPDPANELAATLTRAGHEVVSTWHTETTPRPADDDAEAWGAKSSKNIVQIDGADALVVIASPHHLTREKCVPSGKFVEAGYAMASGIDVFTVGGVENDMLYNHAVRHAADTLGLLVILKPPLFST